MDPVKKIEALEAKRDALEKTLAVPGIDKDREIAIRHNIDTVGAEITKWVELLAHGGTAGGLPMNHVAIQVAMVIRHPTRPALPCAVETFADSGCSFPLLLSEKTWLHVVEHFPDTISPCNERVALAVGEMRMTARAVVMVRMQLSDGSEVSAAMMAYKSDKDLLGLIGLEMLGLLVDAPRKCLKRAIMLAGTHHFVFSGAENGCQAKREGPPRPHRDFLFTATSLSTEYRGNTLSADTHRFMPTITGGALCKICGLRSVVHTM